MALAATTVWEVRSTATPGNLNGGGFVPGGGGTDYSQQDAAQYNAADLTAVNGNTATPDVSSASHTFVAADVGNIIHITAGTNWTAGWYEIKSVSGGAARLDRACASVASPTGGTYYVGGALSLGAANDSSVFANLVGGNVMHIKAGTYTLGQQVAAGNNGTQLAVVRIKGYHTTRGDAPETANRPTINNGALTAFTTGSFYETHNINFTGTAAGVYLVGTNSKLINCRVINTSTTAGRYAISMNGGALAFKCEAISYRGVAILSAASSTLLNNYCHDSDRGIHLSAAGGFCVQGNVVEACVTTAIHITAAAASTSTIIGNTLYGTEARRGIGINMTSQPLSLIVVNNIIYGFASGITHSGSTQDCLFDAHNAFYNNTADVSNWAKSDSTEDALSPEFREVSQITGTAATTSGSVLTDNSADFSDVVDGQDFCYLASGTGITAGMYKITAHTQRSITLDIAPGTSAVADKVYSVNIGHRLEIGPNLKERGAPGEFPLGFVSSYLDVGAAQRPEGSGSGIKNNHLGLARLG